MTSIGRLKSGLPQNALTGLKSVGMIDGAMGMCLSIDNVHAQCLVSLFGAHVLSFINKTDGRERLWLSKRAIFDGNKAIRGGIPVCWPWFGPHASNTSYPSHGYARTQYWQIESAEETLDEQCQENVLSTKIVLVPTNPDLYGFDGLKVKLVIECAESLSISLISVNTGKKTQELSQALHTYLLINNIDEISIEGINGDYADKVNKGIKINAPKPYLITEEVDRIHEANVDIRAKTNEIAYQTVVLNVNHEVFQTISQSGHNSIVVWNPWQDKSSGMPDMEKDAYTSMLCIEAANTYVPSPLFLEPNQIHKLSQIIY